VEIEEVSTRLLERDTEAAGKSTTFDLKRGVIDSEITIDAMKATEVRRIRINLFFHMYVIRSNVLLTGTLLFDFCFIIMNC
jgi:hypothetical protein